jgi:hypothetical protein
MKVHELVSALQALDQEAEVMVTDPMRDSPIYPIWDVFQAIAGNVVIAYQWDDSDLTPEIVFKLSEVKHE